MEKRQFGLKFLTSELRTLVQRRKWPVSARVWTPTRRYVYPCESGWHLADPDESGCHAWASTGRRVYLAEGRGKSIHSIDKTAYASVRLVKFLGTVASASNIGMYGTYEWVVKGVSEFEGLTILGAFRKAKSLELNRRVGRAGVRNRRVRSAADLPSRERLARSVRVKR